VVLVPIAILTFIQRPLGLAKTHKALGRTVDILLILISIITAVYVVLNHDRLLGVGMFFPTQLDQIVFALQLGIVVELCRRTCGNALPLVGLGLVLYAVLGQYLPGLWGHNGYSLERILGTLVSEEGIFGLPMRVMVRYIFLFIMFSVFLEFSGVGPFIIRAANALAGKYRGGPAKVSVVASAAFGTISGSTVANVISTGSFTIPMMKKLGYPPHFAAGVEAVASTGGQFMPPVMVGTAFIVMEFAGVSYATLMLAAALPAVLYYITLLLQIDTEAIKQRLKGLAPEDVPLLKEVLKRGAYLLLPLIILVFDLLVLGRSILHAGLVSIMSCIVISWFKKDTRIGIKRLFLGFYNSTRESQSVYAACAVAGIIIGVLAMTGLGIKLGGLLAELSGGRGWVLIVMTGILGLILGMGMTTTADYIILATVMAPALILAGYPPLSVHLMALYYAVLNAFTPPVALGSFAAAGIAQCSPMKTSAVACRLGIMIYFLPVLFMYNPELLLQGSPAAILTTTSFVVIAVIATAMSLSGVTYFGVFLKLWERALFIVGAIGMATPFGVLRFAGLALCVLVFLGNRQTREILLRPFNRGAARSEAG